MKTVDEYLALPYAVRLAFDRDEDGREGWVATVDELAGCVSQGATPAEAVDRVRDAMAGWISVALDAGDRIPEPRTAGDYSGRFVLRVPKSLHAELARQAELEGVSLNQLASTLLAAGAPWRRAAGPFGEAIQEHVAVSRRVSQRAGSRVVAIEDAPDVDQR